MYGVLVRAPFSIYGKRVKKNNKAYAAADIPPEEADKIAPSGVFQSIEKKQKECLKKVSSDERK